MVFPPPPPGAQSMIIVCEPRRHTPEQARLCATMYRMLQSRNNEPSPFGSNTSSDTTDHRRDKHADHQVKNQLPSIQHQVASTSSDNSTDVISEPCQKPCPKLYTKCILCGMKNGSQEYQYCEICWKNTCSSRPTRKIKKNKRLNKSNNQIKTAASSSAKLNQVVKSTTSPQISFDSENCDFCLTNKKNAVFIHGQIGHICCCYQCGKKVWKSNRRCPICNRLITNVIKVYGK